MAAPDQERIEPERLVASVVQVQEGFARHQGAIETLVGLGTSSLGLGSALIMGAATDDQAGSAAAVEEITYELGAVLGITFLGSLVGAVYRAGLPTGADGAARESVAGAVGGPWFAEAADAFVTAFASVGAVGAVLAGVSAWILLERKKEIWAGILIGLVVAMKPNFAVWPALLLLSGTYRPALASIATVAVVSAIPLAVFGPEIYRQWLDLLASDAQPIRPERVMAELRRFVTPDTVVSADASYATVWATVYLEALEAGMRFITPRGLAGIGWGAAARASQTVAGPVGMVGVITVGTVIAYAPVHDDVRALEADAEAIADEADLDGSISVEAVHLDEAAWYRSPATRAAEALAS